MSTVSDTIVHVKYRFKPQGSDEYITAYFESTLSDIIIPESMRSKMYDCENMQDFCDALAADIALMKPIYQMSYKYDKDRVYPEGKILYESDTGKMRVSDGRTKYSDLQDFGYDAAAHGEAFASDGNVTVTVYDDEGHESETVVPESIEVLDTDPDPETYTADVYALKTGESEETIEGAGEG